MFFGGIVRLVQDIWYWYFDIGFPWKKGEEVKLPWILFWSESYTCQKTTKRRETEEAIREVKKKKKRFAEETEKTD